MRLSVDERKFFYSKIKEICKTKKVGDMRYYVQHGETSTFEHCVAVSYTAYWLHQRFFHCKDVDSLIRGGLLHDFYLYDWHNREDKRNALHGFYHPGIALRNARQYFKLTEVEEDIIEKHMWPMTVMKTPKYKETFVVCIADKICSTAETLHHPVKVYLKY